MALSKDIVDATLAAAREHRIEPAALLAVVEIESAGKPIEGDGVTPRFLFERHKFYSELKARGTDAQLTQATQRGLAHKGWKKATQYKDQGTSSSRLELLSDAAQINRECAYRACSWGLGQTMGFHAEGLGYDNAVEMVEAMKSGGVAVQIECMIKEIKRNKLEQSLARRDWAAFARGYNGPAYAANDYHNKLARAHGKWAALYPGRGAPVELPADATVDVARLGERGALIEGYQKRLTNLGYAVGTVDGIYGSRTRAAVLAFQAENDLTPLNGEIGPVTRAALNSPDARPMPIGERGAVTGDELAKAGSGTVIDARAAKTAAVAIAVGGGGQGAQENLDVLGVMKDWTSELGMIRSVTDPMIDALRWCLSHWWLFAVVACVVIARKTNAIERARVIAHRLGQHLGR